MFGKIKFLRVWRDLELQDFFRLKVHAYFQVFHLSSKGNFDVAVHMKCSLKCILNAVMLIKLRNNLVTMRLITMERQSEAEVINDARL